MKTPQQSYPQLAAVLGVSNIYLKREDLHTYHSHKGRSIPFMIKYAVKKNGSTNFVLSSSGNAALAAAQTISSYNKDKTKTPLSLTIYIGNGIDTKKKKALDAYAKDVHIHIETVDRPQQAAFKLEKETGAVSLRQSTQDIALPGYTELGKELTQIPSLTAIFIPTSSGTTAQGIAMGVVGGGVPIQIHIVQTASCHPLAQNCFGGTTIPTEDAPSLATAIVDKVGHRKESVTKAVTQSGGAGWIVTNEEIKQAIVLVQQHAGIAISPNSALSVAGLRQAIAHGKTFTGAVVCIITGP
ncbi:MAG: PLP-dependent lyase/thiolase [Candidatus Magasanikbacteria bacterium]|jgi:threonine dehydratase|nr:PLP-dependent lyase/thiolase [Candidatus Magasanikbacteria bacterium]